MAKTLLDCIAKIQTLADGLTNVGDPGHNVTDDLSDGIFAVTEPASGEFAPTQHFGKGLHDIRTLLACKEEDYPRYRATLIPLIKSLYDALRADITLAATCDGIESIKYTYGPTKHGPYPVYGAIFTVTVKII